MYASLRRPSARRGSIVPMLAVSVVALFSFVALAIDLGMMMIARTECQNAADTAALTGARTLDNNYPPNSDPNAYDNKAPDADTAARASVTNNVFLNQNFTPARVTKVQIGVYDYYPAAQSFAPMYDAGRSNLTPRFGAGAKPAGKAWSCCRVEVDGTQDSYFARVFGANTMPMAAYAVAVHRPRDIALVLDFSGSMRFSSLTHWETGNTGSGDQVFGLLNPDPYYPQFGHYARYADPAVYQHTNPNEAAITAGSGRPNPLRMTSPHVMGTGAGQGETAAPNNHTMAGRNGPAVVNDFRFDPSGTVGSAVSASALRNAFNRWNGAVPDPANPSANLPPVNTPGDPNNYIAPTYSYGGYNPFDTTSTSGPTPAPDTFATQADSGGVTYVGDRFPRKLGAEVTDGSNWAPTNATGAARDVVELLGLPAALNATRTIPVARPAIANNGSRTEGSSAAVGTSVTGNSAVANIGRNLPANAYRDDGWERNGYDMRVNSYVTSGYATVTPKTSNADPVQDQRFKGYSMGPGYWGKTFFIWPPDPRFDAAASVTAPDPARPSHDTAGRPMCDWRRRFFRRSDGTTRFDPQADSDPAAADFQSINEVLLNPQRATGNAVGAHVLNASGRYSIDYPAVLAWIKSGPQTLPPNLRAGRIVYYTSIPSDINFAGGSTAAADLDKRFWREYIDFVLGDASNQSGYDPRYCLAGTEYNRWPEGAATTNFIGTTARFDPNTSDMQPPNPYPYMNYADNPNRPRMHFWFGPSSMIAFLATRSPSKNWWSGTVNEAQTWQLKAGIQSGIEDIRKNHPNDQAGLAYFAYANFTSTRVAMGQDWESLKNALFYPKSMLTAIKGGDTTTEKRPYNASFGSALTGDITNANGGTDPNTGLALGYNLLSSSTTPNPDLSGRRGASKIVIFETDGVPNSSCEFTLVPAGANSYYTDSGGRSSPGNGDSGVMQDAYDVTAQIVAPVNNNAGQPSGFSLPNAPARVYAIAFGDIFDPASTAAFKPTALSFLLNVQKNGNTSASGDSSIPNYQIITGPYETRIDNLKSALERIFQSGVQVTLIE